MELQKLQLNRKKNYSEVINLKRKNIKVFSYIHQPCFTLERVERKQLGVKKEKQKRVKVEKVVAVICRYFDREKKLVLLTKF